MSTWGVWCRRGDDPNYGWFRHSEGSPIHYQTESEANSVASGLRLLLPQNEYEAKPMPVTDEELFRDALKNTPPLPPSLLYTMSLALIAASEYVRALEEVPTTAHCNIMRERWIEAAAKVTEGCQRHEAVRATKKDDLLIAKEYIDALEAIPGTDLYLRTGASTDAYPQAVLCVNKRKAWIEVEP
jgi:hypothetical protein